MDFFEQTITAMDKKNTDLRNHIAALESKYAALRDAAEFYINCQNDHHRSIMAIKASERTLRALLTDKEAP